jgi:catechol-2,3-dioxygenase
MNIASLQLLTNNLEQVAQFYSEVLGLEITHKDQLSIAFVTASSTVTFIASNIKNPYYHFAFNIPANKIEEALLWMEKRVSVLHISGPTKIADYTNWKAKAFYFFDPANNIVEFIARFDLNNSSHTSFGSSSILEISEIGIVADDVYNKSQHIISNYNLPIYSKQPPLENFTAIGDDHGLLIVVSKEKNWFPTHMPAKPFALKATIISEGKTIDLSMNCR